MNYRYGSILINRNELATGININRNEWITCQDKYLREKMSWGARLIFKRVNELLLEINISWLKWIT